MTKVKRGIWKIMTSNWLFFVATVYLFVFFVPATWFWYEHKSLMVANAKIGNSPVVVMTRKIKRNFEGIRSIQVLPIPPTDGEPHCATSRTQRYLSGKFENLDTTLEEWTRGTYGCRGSDFNKTGSYYVTSCMTVVRPFLGLVPDKQTCIESGPFEITDPTRPVVVVSPPGPTG